MSVPVRIDPDFLDDYPEGNYVVATGSVVSGFEFWGSFLTMREAVEFCQKRQPLLGFCTVVSVKSPDQHPVHPGDDDESQTDL